MENGFQENWEVIKVIYWSKRSTCGCLPAARILVQVSVVTIWEMRVITGNCPFRPFIHMSLQYVYVEVILRCLCCYEQRGDQVLRNAILDSMLLMLAHAVRRSSHRTPHLLGL
jgi:hypothetical protein